MEKDIIINEMFYRFSSSGRFVMDSEGVWITEKEMEWTAETVCLYHISDKLDTLVWTK